MSTRRIESFLLRLVTYTGDDMDPDHWQGRIQHVASGCECQFDQLQQIIDFIHVQIGGERGVLLVCGDVPAGE